MQPTKYSNYYPQTRKHTSHKTSRCRTLYKDSKTLKMHYKNRPECSEDKTLTPPGLEIYRDDKCSVFEISGNC